MAPSDPFQWVGATIDGKYRVDAAVGEGGFGVVYRGHHLGFDEPVAVKCLKIPREMAESEREAFHRRFLEEGKLLHRLSRATAGIVQALDVGAATSPGGAWTPYLVLEWLEGTALDRDLADRRRQEAPPRTLADATELLTPAARALAIAHAQGVAHRDIKPQNLFIAEIGGEKTLKVLDFGIAKVLGEVMSITQAMSETGASVKAFTPQYGAPEQFHRRFGATGPWTDVFALALVFIEVASGRSALDGGDTTQLFIASTDVSLRPSLKQCGVDAPEAVEAVLRRALAVDPRERYHSAGELWDALSAAVAGAGPVPQPEAPKSPQGVPALPDELSSMPTAELLALGASGEDRPIDVAVRSAIRAATPDPPAAAPTEPAPHETAPTELAEAQGRTNEIGPSQDGARTGDEARTHEDGPVRHDAPAGETGSTEEHVPPKLAQPASPPRRRGPPAILGAVAVAAVGIGALFLALQRKPPPPPPTQDPPPEPPASTSKPPPPVPPGMVRIPAGTFQMGSESGGHTEKPVHEVKITKSFDLDRTEVTAGDYQRCVKARKCSPSGVHGAHVEASDIEERGALCTAADPKKVDHPITCIDQEQAAAYCAWAGKRLPTEAEWEYAARGGDGRDYPWGNTAPDCDTTHVAHRKSCKHAKGTLAVGSLPAGASAAGALDMAGNAWEWVADGWDPKVYSKGPQTDPFVPEGGGKGVLRGGSWDFAPSTAKTTFRLAFEQKAGDVATGVRCARTVPPE